MRLSRTSILALPLLAAAVEQQNPLDQVFATAQYYLGKVQSYVPHFNTYHAAEAAAAKAGGANLDVLTIDNWQGVLQSSVKPASKSAEEWWVLLTGDKSCHGMCSTVNTAYNETALLFKVDPTAPHLAYVNCDYQPILCNSWAGGPPSVWIFEVSATAPTPVHIVKLNVTTASIKTFTDLKLTKSWKETPAYEGYFHPFDGPIAQYGLAVPVGWVTWVFSIVPSWVFMISISFLSRTFLTRKTQLPAGVGVGGRAPAPPARAQ